MEMEEINFHKKVQKVVTDAGMFTNKANKFNGAIKSVRASEKDHYFIFKRNNKNILVKSLEQKISGSAADKIAMFYLNLQETPYDVVLIVANTTIIDMFNPLIKFFQKRQMELDNVKIMTIEDFKIYVNKTV